MTAKKTITGMMIAAGMLFSGSHAAYAVASNNASTSGETKVSVNVPDFIILHYYSDLTMNFAAPTQNVDEGSKSWDVSWSGAVDGEGLNEKDLAGVESVNDGDKVSVALNDVWAVRGFSPSGNAGVSIEVQNKTLSNEKSEIEMQNVQLTSSYGNGSKIEVQLNGISASRATRGGIAMNLDFTKTTTSGLHEGGKYTITAQTI